MLDLHMNARFPKSLRLIHARDVINLDFFEGVQKTFARSHHPPVPKMFISTSILAFQHLETDAQCIGFYRTLSEGQEIDIKSIFFRTVSFERI